MILFNLLYITPDGKQLVIEALIEDFDYFDNVYIESVHVEKYKNPEDFTGLPLDRGVAVIEPKVLDTDTKKVQLVVSIDGDSDRLFFVYVYAKGKYGDDAPCGTTGNMIIGVAYNRYALYKSGMTLLKSLEQCTINRSFTDYILKWHLLKMCILTGHYKEAIDCWNQLILNKLTGSLSAKKCGCHA